MSEFRTVYSPLIWISCIVLLATGVHLAWGRAGQPEYIGIDLVQFRLAALHIRAGGAPDLYEPDVRSDILDQAWQAAQTIPESRYAGAVSFRHDRSLELYSSPFLYSTYTVFPDATYEESLQTFHAMSIMATIIGCLGFGLTLRIPRTAVVVAAAMLAASGPLIVDLNVANVNQLQLGMLGILLLLRRFVPGNRGDLAAAVWMGLCMAFKPSLIWCVMLILMHSLRVRDRSRLCRLAAGGAVGVTAAVALSLLWFDLHHWPEWFRAVSLLPDDIIKTEQGNFSPTYFAVRTLGWPGWIPSIAGPGVAALCGLVFMRRQPLSGRSNETIPDTQRTDAVLLAMGCLVYLLTARLVWFHYLVLSVPAMLVVLSMAAAEQSRVMKYVSIAVVAWCAILLGIQPLDGWIGSPPQEHFLRCLMANLMLLVMLMAFSSPPEHHENRGDGDTVKTQ